MNPARRNAPFKLLAFFATRTEPLPAPTGCRSAPRPHPDIQSGGSLMAYPVTLRHQRTESLLLDVFYGTAIRARTGSYHPGHNPAPSLPLENEEFLQTVQALIKGVIGIQIQFQVHITD